MQSVGIAALFGACATLLRKTSGGPARLDAQPAWHRCLGHPQGRCNCWVLAPSWALLNRSIRVRAFAGDEACGEPEEGNHELGSSEPTRRDHSGVSLCFNGWDRYRSYSTKDTKGSLRFLDPVLYSTCTISTSFSLECEKAHVFAGVTVFNTCDTVEQHWFQVMEFPLGSHSLRCTEPGAGPPNAQADGECCFLALWRPVIIPM